MATDRYVDESGTTTGNGLGDAGVALFLVDQSNYVELPGVRQADRYTVNAVPVGPYVVRHRNRYYVSTTDLIDLGYGNYLGRPDTRLVPPQESSLTLSVAGLPAWGDGDDLMLFSQGANLYGFVSAGLTQGPLTGQVPTSFTLDYGAVAANAGVGAVEAAKGDTLWLAHQRPGQVAVDQQPGALDDGGTALSPFSCSQSTGWARISNLDVRPGSNTAAATFTAGPARTFALGIPRSQWAARESELLPGAVLLLEDYYLLAEPFEASTSADLVHCSQTPDTTWPLTDINTSVTVSDPYPAGWVRAGVGSATYSYPATIPDAGTWSSRGSVFARAALGSPIVPLVHSPVDLRVNGIAAAQLESLPASAPVGVTWSAHPSPPAATSFEVRLLRMTRTDGVTSRRVMVMATTRQRSFTFPGGVLVPGGIYFVRVSALTGPSTEAKPSEFPATSSADAFTRPFIAR